MARRSSPADGLDGATRALVVELTALVLAQLAPDELAVLDDSADEYFADPSAALRPASGDSPLGSGITVAMMTPYLLAASSAVLPVLGAMAGDLGKDVAKDLLKDSVVKQIRLRFKRHPDETAGLEALTPEQAHRIRDTVLAQSHAAGLPSEQAALIADATVGALHVRE
jgi:hypothetical protein